IINISNEFNTIVSNLREGLSVMNANGSRPASKKVPTTRIQSSVTSLENLIRDSNTLNLLEQGDYSVRRVNFSIRKLSEEVIQRVLAATMQPRKRLILELPPEDEEFAGDPDLIATALYHLLENALLYSLGQVELSVDRVPGRLEIAVRDEGPGLAIDQQEQIFQKFVRAAEDQDRIPGSGIGLAIVDMIARQLKGEILLESGQGFFSTFTLRLPVSQT
ncbi:MAG: hypothetical protein KDK30_18475, partial [Leptospiraceae bacterium]|nr:hypothetical protein [Leptospiraceae bacterium]